MDAVSTNQIADILQFKDNSLYLFSWKKVLSYISKKTA